MADVAQRNFAGGELSGHLFFRADQVKYLSGCRTALNFFVRKSGGLSNRPGLRFVTECETAGTPTARRLMKFVFSDQDTYVLEFSAGGTGYMRVIRNGALVVIPVPAAWNIAAVYAAGQTARYLGVDYVAILGSVGEPPDISPTFWLPIVAGVFRTTHPYTAATLSQVRYQQSGDVIIMAQPDTTIQQLSRYLPNDFSWRFQAYSLNPVSTPPVGPGAAFPGGPNNYDYAFTTVLDGTFEESLPVFLAVAGSAVPTPAAPINLNWGAVTGAAEYNVYRAVNGKYGYIGSAQGTTFSDINYDPDTSLPPPRAQTLFNSVGNYPSIVAFIQQRLCFAASYNEPEKVWMSKIGLYRNFTVSLPQQDDDSVSFALAGRKISRVRALLEAGTPFVLTANGEWTIQGDDTGAILPTAINPRQKAYNGSSPNVDPVIIDDTAIYVQGRGSVVRDLRYKFEGDGYEGRDLTVYSGHLFEGFQIVAWDFAQNPHSILWAVRDDGVLLSLSYLREHQIWGWTRHTTDGYFRDVVVVPEGDEDIAYFIVERRINNVTRYYIERMNERIDDDPADAFYVDSGLSYDGTNTTATTMTVPSAISMTVNDVIDLNASAAIFSAGDVGDAIVLYRYDSEGNLVSKVTLTILAYFGSFNVEVSTDKDLSGPNAVASDNDWFVANPLTTWAWARNTFTNLGHLEGKPVAILADGNVVTNGYEEPDYVVTGGSVTIPRPAVKVHIGLPYTSDFESLDVEARDGSTIRQRAKIVTHVGALVKSTSALKAGTNFDNMNEYKIRDDEAMGEPTELRTGYFDVGVSSGWDEETRVCIRQDNPLPVTLSGIVPRYQMGN